MLSLLLLLLLLPRSTLATPPSPPKITQLVFSGNGCPVNSNSVKASTAYLGDSAGFSFTMLDGEATKNCEIHVQSSGGSQGWQVAIGEIVYEGDVWLKGQSAIQTVTQVYWSEDAGNTAVLTGDLTCTESEIKGYASLSSSTTDLKWSKCTGMDGNPGILNVDFRPVVQGEFGYFDFQHAAWDLQWRKC